MIISEEMWVAIIGALAAIIGAFISTVSIILTNKNKKSINQLENSKNVKSDIADKRYLAYRKIIDYINSWYDVKHRYDHEYMKCEAKQYLKTAVFENRLKNNKNLIEELEKVSSLSLEYFYLDKKIYYSLKALEMYLGTVVSYAYNETIDNFPMFSYIIYCDIWNYILDASKYVNKFIRNENILKYQASQKFKKNKSEKMFYRTEFYNIYFKFLIHKKFVDELEEEKNPLIETYNKDIKEDREKLKETENRKIKRLLKRKIRITIRAKRSMQKIRYPRKYNRYKFSDDYKMWQICNTCLNEKCPLSNKNKD